MAKKQKYTIEMFFNGDKFVTETTDVNAGILELKPEMLHTELFINIGKDGHMLERRFDWVQGKKLFNDNEFREMFMTNILF